jgi:hypothetical protein
MHIFDVRARNSVLIQLVCNEGLVLALDATSWRADASLVQSSRGGFLCHLHKSTDVFGYSGKFFTIN